MTQESVDTTYRKKYPQEKAVMKEEKQARFIAKCKSQKIGRSTAINALIDMWLAGEVTINPAYLK